MRCFFALLLVAGCGKPCTGPTSSYLTTLPTKLSDYCVLDNNAGVITAKNGGVVYELNTPLFSDYAEKTRIVWLPPGKSATYADRETFDLPTGSIIAKSFAFAPDLRTPTTGAKVVETRILLKTANGWQGYPYRWNDKQSEAVLEPAGEVVPIDFIAPDGNAKQAQYLVPTESDCKKCHENHADNSMYLLGISARQLNRDHAFAGGTANQLTYWSNHGLLAGAPDAASAPRLAVWNDPTTGTLDDRARAYLEANCAHCHNDAGAARTTGLYLNADESDPIHYGFCKQPVAAGQGTGGFSFDIVPGAPDVSVLSFRLDSVDPAAMMPQIGRSVKHDEGSQLVSDWITSLTGSCSSR